MLTDESVVFTLVCVRGGCWDDRNQHILNNTEEEIYAYYTQIDGDRIPVGAKFSAPIQADPGAYPASYTMGTGFLSRGVALTTHSI
jgi:hypothetical protein